MNSCGLILPALTSSLNCQTSVPEPMSWPRYLPFSIGPPETTSAGRSQLAAPMTSDGVVLSQPQSSTTPSIGLPRIDSSTSMLTRLRNSIAVGRMFVSPVDVTGNSSGSAARFPDAALDVLGELAEVRVARRQFRPGVADADDRPPVEDVLGQALVPHPAAMDEAVLVVLAEPGGGSVRRFLVVGSRGSDSVLGQRRYSRGEGGRTARRRRGATECARALVGGGTPGDCGAALTPKSVAAGFPAPAVLRLVQQPRGDYRDRTDVSCRCPRSARLPQKDHEADIDSQAVATTARNKTVRLRLGACADHVRRSRGARAGGALHS